MCVRYLQTRHSKTFMTTEVSATGLQSWRQVVLVFLGTGMITADLKDAGTIALLRDQACLHSPLVQLVSHHQARLLCWWSDAVAVYRHHAPRWKEESVLPPAGEEVRLSGQGSIRLYGTHVMYSQGSVYLCTFASVNAQSASYCIANVWPICWSWLVKQQQYSKNSKSMYAKNTSNIFLRSIFPSRVRGIEQIYNFGGKETVPVLECYPRSALFMLLVF